MNLKFPVPKALKSVKYTLAAVNGVFLLTGILLLIVGVVILVANSEYEDLITRRFFTMPSFVIATGVIIFLTSILGFYGAISEQFYFIAGVCRMPFGNSNAMFCVVYVVMLLVVLVFEIAMVIVAFGLRSDAASEIQSTMLASLRLYSTQWQVARMWDELQREFQCCGVGGRFDWVSNQIPVSCCHIDYGVIGSFTCDTANAHTTGCAAALGELLSYNAFVIAVCAVLVTCLQVPITAIAGWMAWRSKFEEVELES